MVSGLSGWRHRASHVISAQAGAVSPYVFAFKVYYGSGVNGTEALTGGAKGVTAGKVYCASDCNTDFTDIRFTGPDATTLSSYWLDTKTDSNNALFWVKVTEDVASAATTVYVYWGNNYATSLSSASDTFRRVIASDVVATLPMNEGTGNCTDYSGNSNTGSVVGATWVTTGKFGTALSFDGGSDTVTIATSDTLDLTATLSVAAWIKIADLTANVTVYSRQGQCWMYFTPTGTAEFDNATDWSASVTTETETTDVWYHVVWVWDKNATPKVQVYIDGTAQTMAGGATNISSGATYPVNIGSYSAVAHWFNGIINGVTIYSKALTQPEITDLAAYYPQCSTANTGKLYLRSCINPEPAHSTWGTALGLPSHCSRRARLRREHNRRK